MSLYNSDLIRGSIDTIILSVLIEGDNYGYSIIKEIFVKSDECFELKEPTLYSSLRRLESQGMIESYWGGESQGGRRKYYRITEEGIRLYKKNSDEWETNRDIIERLIKVRKGGVIK